MEVEFVPTIPTLISLLLSSYLIPMFTFCDSAYLNGLLDFYQKTSYNPIINGSYARTV